MPPLTPTKALTAAGWLLAAASSTLGGCDPHPAPRTDATAARTLITELPEKGRAPKTGYTRTQFGPAWTDVDHNGCDTRNDILARDLTHVEVAPDGCQVQTGTLTDPYSGHTITFVRGNRKIDIDHVVPLSDAWQKGAAQWSDQKRTEFANDPRNLTATTEAMNTAKGDSDAATWLPPNRVYRCTYVSTQAAVKHAYGLWVTPTEKAAMTRTLETCPEGS